MPILKVPFYSAIIKKNLKIPHRAYRLIPPSQGSGPSAHAALEWGSGMYQARVSYLISISILAIHLGKYGEELQMPLYWSTWFIGMIVKSAVTISLEQYQSDKPLLPFYSDVLNLLMIAFYISKF
ncbi:hypothetical protein AVEN_141337-1 [Araneus ventricosus]|uniref:Uncharacterized protein n=1 Tax=Araneus ventricosus TaxID=182803 RepID=A0A4Y2IWZ3_ARAVE|nr:hypothetical protein AVEN_141337-1 [Araneus ventricosus]